MRYLSIICSISLLLLLSGCIGSLSETLEVEGGKGQNKGAAGVKLSEIFQIPPEEKYQLVREWPLDSGNTIELGPVSYILTFIQDKLVDAVEEIFKAIAEEQWFSTLIQLMFTLVIILYAAGVLMGLVRADGYDIIIRIIKVLIVFVVATDYDTFSFFVQDLLNNSMLFLIEVVTGTLTEGQGINYTDADGVIQIPFADNIVSMILSPQIVRLLYGLFSPTIGAGPIYGLLMLLFILFFLLAILRALYLIVVALLIRALLFAIAPLFLIMVLFRQTQSLFDGWVKQIVNFSLQPVILFAFLGFYYQLVIYFLAELTTIPAPVNYDTAYQSPGGYFTFYWVFLGMPGDKADGLDAQLPMPIGALLALLIVTYVMKQMIEWAIAQASFISQAFTSYRALSNGLQNSFNWAKQNFGFGSGNAGGGARRRSANRAGGPGSA